MVDAKDIIKIFTSAGKTLGSVESYTGGSFASDVTSISGASKIFKGALVTYATIEKIKLLGIAKTIIQKYGVVSKQTAIQMAKRGRKILGVDYCVSFTGNAGPSAMENKPVGEVYIAIASIRKVRTISLQLKGSRSFIRQKSVLIAYETLKHILLEK